MAQSKEPTRTDAEIEAMFQGIGDDDSISTPTPSAATSQATTTKPTPAASDDADEEDPLAELKSLAAGPRTSTSSRPGTPQVLPSSASTSTRTRSPTGKRTDLYTPTTGSGRSSEEKAATEANTTTNNSSSTDDPNAAKPTTRQPPRESSPSTASSWWGGLSAIASAAVKQAEAAVKEIQKNEEAQKWAEQVKGNYGALRGLGGEIRSRALPTFTTILQTLAPPISQHERLQIHITHDLVNYPSLDPIIYQTFSRVMSQVEGGDLLVIQRGSESSRRRSGADSGLGGSSSSSSGWNDGPWWRQNDADRSLGIVKGLVEGTKLVRVSAEAYGNEFFAAKGGVEEAAKQATAVLSDDNPVRSSDIFLAIQAIGHVASQDHFAGAAVSAGKAKTEGGSVVDDDEKPDELVAFAVHLHDPIHSIAFSTLSQSFPQKWADWVDAKSTEVVQEDGGSYTPQLPEEILEIINSGGVDPREWIAEWMEEIIALAVGVVAQRYVARRMGVGEGGIGRGKRREVVEESGGGEAARAV